MGRLIASMVVGLALLLALLAGFSIWLALEVNLALIAGIASTVRWIRSRRDRRYTRSHDSLSSRHHRQLDRR